MDFTSMTMTDNPTSSAVTTSPTPGSGVSMMSEMGGGGRNSGSGAGGGVLFGEEGGDGMFQAHQSHNASIAGSHNMAKLRRDSIAHSQGMGGVSWGSLTIGSWLRDEVMLHATLKNSRSNSQSKSTTIHLHPTHHNTSSASPPHGQTASIRRPSHFSAGSPPGAHNAYLPSLEKQYCKDYSCCGLSLPGLHDLLRHYEEAHIATSPGSAIPTGNAAYSTAHAAASQQKKKSYQGTAPRQASHTINYAGNRGAVAHQQQHIIQQQPHHRHPGGTNGQAMSQQRIPLSPTTTGAAHGSLNMAGINSTLADPTGAVAGQAPPQLHLNGNLVDAVSTNDVFLQANASHQHTTHNPQMLRRRGDMGAMNAVPNASHNGKIPIAAQHSFNTYSLNAASKNGQRNTNRPNNNAHMAMNSASKFSHPMQVGMELDFMDEEDMIGGDIDDPAFMRLTNPLAHGPNSAFGVHAHMSTARFNTMSLQTMGHPTPPPSTTTGTVPPHVINDEDEDDDDDDDDDDEDTAIGNSAASKTKSTRHNNHRQEGYIDDPARRLYVMDHEEHKPFKCPVIGCDKTYKNQNGLKYHKVHGHQNQKLHENPDGTFSIIDPESNEPYPDGMGYEKDKPYRCEVCGKRYKNLNGLKYHRGHSTH